MPGSLIGGTGGASAGNPPGSPGEDGNAGIVGAGGLLIGGQGEQRRFPCRHPTRIGSSAQSGAPVTTQRVRL
ncbi:hypothetical protein MMEU_4815 [Mycobacterium marinum str. Europe]|nr:hypothetical protein MMEU_4815 [Mycobacterium marinum str. Europe]